jgi:hypothetical protein
MSNENLDMQLRLAAAGAATEDGIVLPNGTRITPVHWGMFLYSAMIRLPDGSGWALAGPMVSRDEALRRAIAEVNYIAPDGVSIWNEAARKGPRPPHMDLPSVILHGPVTRSRTEPNYLVQRGRLGQWSCILMCERHAYYGWIRYHLTRAGAERHGRRWVSGR